MSPLWLMGEALTGQKPGTKFSKGKGRLVVVAEEVREVVKSSARDVVVIVEQKRKKHGDGKAGAEAGEEVDGEFNPGKVAEVIRAAGYVSPSMLFFLSTSHRIAEKTQSLS